MLAHKLRSTTVPVVRVAIDPRRAHIDRLDQQVTEHPIGVRHAGLRDALHGILHDGGAACRRKPVWEGQIPLVNR